MVTISLCMIVKNEEKVLGRCLESLKGLFEEIIIVDTGSVDRTKEIALKYGAKIYDFDWINDFSAARNFAFSKATCDYIYSADADEVIDKENYLKFQALKSVLELNPTDDLPVDIVQMYYCGQLSSKSVYNFDKELRPKLYKRIRSFIWEEPIHEQVRLNPVIFDSDIEIIHKPEGDHSSRDFAAFENYTGKGKKLSSRLLDFYTRELYMAGRKEDLEKSVSYLTSVTEDENTDSNDIQKASIILCKFYRITDNIALFMKYALKDSAIGMSSEICCELGDYYLEHEDAKEASLWYYNAAFSQSAVLDIFSSGKRAFLGLGNCFENLGDEENAFFYKQKAKEWKTE